MYINEASVVKEPEIEVQSFLQINACVSKITLNLAIGSKTRYIGISLCEN